MKRSKKNKFSFLRNLLVFITRIIFILATIAFGIALILLITGKQYSSQAPETVTPGVTFSSRQAREFNEDPEQVLNALLDDAGFRRFRIMSYWDDIEPVKGTYDYTNLDKQISTIEKRGGEITLAIGLRQPRWPECYIPSWAKDQPLSAYRKELDEFIKETVKRYKDNKSIVSWQLENEFHLDVFGKCPDHDRKRLVEEFNLVKSIDQSKPLIMSLANNYFGFPTGEPRPDQFGVSIYTRVFEGRIIKSYFTYPFPNWYYSGRAAITKLLTNRDSMIHELQLEPWGPKNIWEMSLAEQDQSMSIERIQRQLKFAKESGLNPIDMWGAEWWYWRKYTANDHGPWDSIKKFVQESNKITPQ